MATRPGRGDQAGGLVCVSKALGMSYPLHPKAVDAIQKLTPDQRYQHFLARLVDWRECYGRLSTEEILLWPHPSFAEIFSPTESHRAFKLEELLDNLLLDGAIQLRVFPTSSDAGKLVDSTTLRTDVLAELTTLGEVWGEEDDEQANAEMHLQLRANIELQQRVAQKQRKPG